MLDLEAGVDVLVEPRDRRDAHPESAARAHGGGQAVRGDGGEPDDDVPDAVPVDDRLEVGRRPQERRVARRLARRGARALVDEADGAQPELRLVGQAPGDLGPDRVGADDERPQLPDPRALPPGDDRAIASRPAESRIVEATHRRHACTEAPLRWPPHGRRRRGSPPWTWPPGSGRGRRVVTRAGGPRRARAP